MLSTGSRKLPDWSESGRDGREEEKCEQGGKPPPNSRVEFFADVSY